MKSILRAFLLPAFLTTSSYAIAQDPILVDFEQFPISNGDDCPIVPYEEGASFSGGTVVQSPYPELSTGHVYRTIKPIYGGWFCFFNPMEIGFEDPASLVSFDLHSQSGGLYTIADDTGWTVTINMGLEYDVWYGHYKKTISVPSAHVHELSIQDHCGLYTDGTGCFEHHWYFYIDNVTFKPERPCLAVNGPADIEPNDAGRTSKNIAIVVEVTDCEGNPMSDIAVEASVTTVEGSGGHTLLTHATPRPAGGLRDTPTGAGTETLVRNSDGSGEVQFQFVPPESSGTHVITAKCAVIECYDPDPPLSVDVKINDLIPIPAANIFYTLTEYLPGTTIGKNIGDNGRHDGANHNLTREAAENLSRIAFDYAALQNYYPVPEKLHVNDASLPLGGLFDIYGSWTVEHKFHRKGSVVDIRGNESPGAVPQPPQQLAVQLKLAAQHAGASANFERFSNNPGRNHYHVLLKGAQE